MSMSASLSTSLRADYGGALNRCVAIFGRADQHSAGAEGAPYRLSIAPTPQNVPRLPHGMASTRHAYGGCVRAFMNASCTSEHYADHVPSKGSWRALQGL
eukprot:scaffold2315_cov145-Isochrysis_galbana.AAC.2